MMKRGNRKLLGAMLQTLMGYPDHPYGYGDIGYWDFEDSDQPEWVPVVTPPDLDPEKIRNKERDFVDHACAEVAAGQQFWGYCQMTETKDVMPRIERLFMDRGLRVSILRAKKVKTTERENWIAKHGPKSDVILSHPKVVETGMDFFDYPRTYNFNSIGFYQPSMSLFTSRQASRRAWRIGQDRACKVSHFMYANTFQSRMISLLGKKLVEAELVEGKFSSSGLAAMSGDDEGSLVMAMAKSLIHRLDDMDPSKHWKKVRFVGGHYAEAT